MQNGVRRAHRFQFKAVEQLEGVGVCFGVGHELDGKEVGADVARVAFAIGGAGFGMNFIFSAVSAFPLDMRSGRRQTLHFGKALGIAIDEVGVLGNVTDDLNAGGQKIVAPLRLDGTDKMNEMEAFTGKLADAGAKRLDFRLGSVQMFGIEHDHIVFIVDFRFAFADERGAGFGRVEQLKTPVISDQTAALCRDLLCQRGIADFDLVPVGRSLAA